MEYTGQCLCGNISYKSTQPFGEICFCHCISCQKNYGTYASFTWCKKATFTLTGHQYLKWYQSSLFIKRGFCTECGSSLFWEDDRCENIFLLAGTIDKKEALHGNCHIFFEEKPPYYDVGKQLPKYKGNLWEDPNHEPTQEDLNKARII